MNIYCTNETNKEFNFNSKLIPQRKCTSYSEMLPLELGSKILLSNRIVKSNNQQIYTVNQMNILLGTLGYFVCLIKYNYWTNVLLWNVNYLGVFSHAWLNQHCWVWSTENSIWQSHSFTDTSLYILAWKTMYPLLWKWTLSYCFCFIFINTRVFMYVCIQLHVCVTKSLCK